MNKPKLVTRLEDIPDSFESEDEEREWWGSHELSDDGNRTIAGGRPGSE